MHSVNTQLKQLVDDYSLTLCANDAAFLGRIFSTGLETYASRLQAAGFSGMGAILDAGCGFGQWSLSLADLNQSVTAIDVSPDRIDFLNKAAKALALPLETHVSSIDATGLTANSFDAVFCYGVLFLTPWKESLAELSRLLRPGGRIYVNANGLGWYKHLWYNRPNAARDYDPAERAGKVLLNTWNYHNNAPVENGMDILIEPEELQIELETLGFSSILRAGEGQLRIGESATGDVQSFFQSEYLGDTGVYEMTAIKQG